MSSPIGDRLEHELGVIIHHGQADIARVWQHITGHTSPASYDSSGNKPGNTGNITTQEQPVSLSTIAAAFRNDLDALYTSATTDAERVKAGIEEKLPEIERIGQLLDSDPLVQLAINDFVPAPLRQIAAEAVTSIVKAFQAAPAQPAPPADPAQPAA